MVQYYTEKLPHKKVWFEGTDTLYEGYALCADRDDILTAKARSAGPHHGSPDLAADAALTAGYENWGRYMFVEKPKAGNLQDFVGLVADESDGFTGPGFLAIVEASGTARVLMAFTDQSVTINSTLLTVQAGSYALGAIGKGVVVAKAVQTVDRSTTNGLAQVVLAGVDPLASAGFGTPTGSLNVFSSNIWESCPWSLMVNNPGIGYTFFDDFVNPCAMASATAKQGYFTYQDTGVTIEGLETSDEVGGILEVANNDADNDEGHICVASSITSNMMKIGTDGKPCWFEARVKTSTITTDKLCWAIGIGEEGIGVAEALVDDTGVIVVTKDFLGFHILADDGDAIIPAYQKGSQTKQDGTTIVPEADTYINLGFVYNGATMTFYANNVSKFAVTAANIAAATFPRDEEMTLCLLTKTTATAEAAFHMDWWRFAQLR